MRFLSPPFTAFHQFQIWKVVSFFIPLGGLYSIPPPWGRLGEGRHIVKLIPMQMAFPLPASPKGGGECGMPLSLRVGEL